MCSLADGEPLADAIGAPSDARPKSYLRILRRLRLTSPVKWVLAVVAIPLGWPVPTIAGGRGLDASWSAALSLALEHGLRFGHEVAYTYGPLGFMSPPTMWWRPTAMVGLLMVAAVTCLLARLVLEAACEVLPLLPAVLVTYIVMRVAAIAEPAETLGLVICFAALLAVQGRVASHWVVVSTFAVGCAFAFLVKFDAGLEAALTAAVASWWLGVRRWRSVAQFIASFALSLTVLWLCAGQRLPDLPTWLKRSWDIGQGYSVAMAYYDAGHRNEVTMALFFLPTILLAAKWAHRRGIGATATLVAILVFFQAKHGTVRYQVGGPYLAGAALPVVLAWQRRARVLILALPAVLLTYLFTLAPPAHLSTLSLSPAATSEEFFTQAADVLSASRSRRLESAARLRDRNSLRVSPAVLAALHGRRVFVDPVEVSAAWAYQLRWQPVPVFQRFSAYLPSLDSANAAFLMSPQGPDVVLHQRYRGSIDGRNGLWDSPAMTLALSCNFATTVTDKHWQVWSRVSPRCGPPQLVGEATAQPGQPVTVPVRSPDDTLLFARVTIPTPLSARLLAALYRPLCPASLATTQVHRYRLVPATAADGLILSEPAAAPFGVVKAPASLTFHCLPGSPIHIAFFAMRYTTRLSQEPDAAPSGNGETHRPHH